MLENKNAYKFFQDILGFLNEKSNSNDEKNQQVFGEGVTYSDPISFEKKYYNFCFAKKIVLVIKCFEIQFSHFSFTP